MSKKNVVPIFEPAEILKFVAEFECPHCQSRIDVDVDRDDENRYHAAEENRFHQCESCRGFVDCGAVLVAAQEANDE